MGGDAADICEQADVHRSVRKTFYTQGKRFDRVWYNDVALVFGEMGGVKGGTPRSCAVGVIEICGPLANGVCIIRRR